jgi:hypothetical protein
MLSTACNNSGTLVRGVSVCYCIDDGLLRLSTKIQNRLTRPLLGLTSASRSTIGGRLFTMSVNIFMPVRPLHRVQGSLN